MQNVSSIQTRQNSAQSLQFRKFDKTVSTPLATEIRIAGIEPVKAPDFSSIVRKQKMPATGTGIAYDLHLYKIKVDWASVPKHQTIQIFYRMMNAKGQLLKREMRPVLQNGDKEADFYMRNSDLENGKTVAFDGWNYVNYKNSR
jgi:hypothetical protein